MLFKHSIRLLMMLLITVFILACDEPTQATTVEANEVPELSTRVNVIGGVIEGVEQNGIFLFKGIPFAAPPVGDLRWKSPQPVISWEGVKKTDKFAPGPMQDTAFGAAFGGPQEISEDCLYLNVWTGAKKIDEKRPVMVWIYGGGFGLGMTSTPVYDGASLAKKGVVLVSVAYRVGPLGFLAHPELSAESGSGSGVYGIQDQIAGLKWVKDNIDKFGGDPDNVTIFGESAGGMSVGMLSASPMAKGLFHKAISESGGAMRPPRITLKEAEEMGKKYLSVIGADTIAAARVLSAEEIQKNTKGMGSFKPVADGVTIVKSHYGAYESSSFNDTPILVGTNSNEGDLFITQPIKTEIFKQLIKFQYPSNEDEMLKVYPHATDDEATQSAKDMMRDSTFAWPTWAWATLQSRNGKNKAFVYYFDHRIPGVPGGANHCAEIPYVFGNFGGKGPMNERQPTAEDRALHELISTYWINFAKNGDPNGEGLPKWPPFDEKDQKVMHFNGESKVIKHPNLEKIMAFDAYYANVREKIKTAKGGRP